jgi:hypothetical protein
LLKVPPVVELHEDQPVPDPPDQPSADEVQGFSARALKAGSSRRRMANARLPKVLERPGDAGETDGKVVFMGRSEKSLNLALAACVLDPSRSSM